MTHSRASHGFQTAAQLEKGECQMRLSSSHSTEADEPVLPQLTGPKAESSLNVFEDVILDSDDSQHVDSKVPYAMLQVVYDDDTIEDCELGITTEQNFDVGRAPWNDLVIENSLTSNRHFSIHLVQISHEYDPLCYLADLSTNGTFYRECSADSFHKIGRHKQVLLSDGDQVMIKQVCLITFRQELRFSPPEELFERYQADFANRDWHLTRRILGSGSFATVYLAKGRVPTEQVACKVINLTNSRELHDQDVCKREIEILKKVSHPNITHAHQILLTKEYAFIVTDLISAGDLFSYVHSRLLYGRHRMADAERQIAWITWQVLKAVEYLHHRHIVHRDIKLENVLVADARPYGRVLLADFGMACDLTMKHSSSGSTSQTMSSRSGRMNSRVGTAAFQAPEMLCSRNGTLRPNHASSVDYGPEVDLWSIGCLVHEMVLGYSPFGISKTDGVHEICRKTVHEDLSFHKVPLEQLSSPVRDLLSCLLERNPKSRMTIKGAFGHPWLNQHKNAFDLLHKKIMANWKQKATIVKQLDSIPEVTSAYDVGWLARKLQISERRKPKAKKKKPRLIEFDHTIV